MHATLITSKGLSRQSLDSEILSRARGNPGFVAGYWLARTDDELAVVVYKDEHDARVAASRVVPPPGVELTKVEVCEVIGRAEKPA